MASSFAGVARRFATDRGRPEATPGFAPSGMGRDLRGQFRARGDCLALARQMVPHWTTGKQTNKTRTYLNVTATQAGTVSRAARRFACGPLPRPHPPP